MMEKKIENKILSMLAVAVLMVAILCIVEAIRYPGKETLAKEYEHLVLQGEILSGTIISIEGSEKYYPEYSPPNAAGRSYLKVTIEYVDRSSAEKRIVVEDWNPVWSLTIREGDSVRLHYLPSNRYIRIASENDLRVLEAKQTLGLGKK